MENRQTLFPLILVIIAAAILTACSTPTGDAAGPDDPAGIRAAVPVAVDGQTTNQTQTMAETATETELPAPVVEAGSAAPAPAAAAPAAGNNGAGLHQNLPIIPEGELSKEEVADLIFMREEEKLAHDVYIYLDELWELPIFANIAAAESQHMASVLSVMEAYGIDDAAAGQPAGQFTDPGLQALYDELTGQGSLSAADALLVGGLIEETDIADLDEALAQTENPILVQLFNNLRLGSTNHLLAFSSNYERQSGVAYTPQLLDADTYAAALAGASIGGNGYGQGGNGQGNNGNNGQSAGASSQDGQAQGRQGGGNGNGYRGGRG